MGIFTGKSRTLYTDQPLGKLGAELLDCPLHCLSTLSMAIAVLSLTMNRGYASRL